jgi:twitching motility protein PilT
MYSAIQTGQTQGMQTLDQNLQQLVKRGLVAKDEARTRAQNKTDFM